jgi:hypothetical protein
LKVIFRLFWVVFNQISIILKCCKHFEEYCPIVKHFSKRLLNILHFQALYQKIKHFEAFFRKSWQFWSISKHSLRKLESVFKAFWSIE